MNTDFVLTESQRQMHRRQQMKLTSMKKSWSTDSLSSLAGGSKTCLCAPTSHAGSFKCRHHRHPSNLNQVLNQPGANTIFEEKSEADESTKPDPEEALKNTTDNKADE